MILNLLPLFYPIFTCVDPVLLGIQIRIHKAPEYESNTNPDPQYCLLVLLYTCSQVRGAG